ncbi:YeeE/YedE family protein [Bosea sp. TWI1241]|uniref:YeeE/YedE family protein n=1 Tax=Bosea sp. TWI1241 TaxID=3148904 RepID=UPI00320960A2
MSAPGTVIWAGFGLGIVLGAAGRLSGFCLYRGLKERWSGGDGRPLRGFALALLVALVGTQALQFAGWIELGQSAYLRTAFSAPAIFLGGLVFGAGMVLANGCGFRALVLLGGGNLRSLVVLLCLGTAGYAALTGVLAGARGALGQIGRVELSLPPSLPELLALAGLPAGAATLLVTGLVALALLAFVLRERAPAGRRLADSPALVFGSALVGACIVAGWAVTGVLGADDFEPVPLASASFIVPVGDTLLYLMQAVGRALAFGPALVAGVVVGSFLLAAARRDWRIEGFSAARPVGRYLAGGALMGVGGVFAVGCSIGQGLSGASTLSLTSLVAIAGILAGTALTLRATTTPSTAFDNKGEETA